MKEALIVFSIIGLAAACIVFDQYTAEERKAILAKMGINMPAGNKAAPSSPQPDYAPTPSNTGQPYNLERSISERRQEEINRQVALNRIEREKALANRLERERIAREKASLARFETPYAHQEKKRKETICEGLYADKEHVKNEQRRYSSDALNQRHREIDNDIFKYKCGFN